MVITSSQIDLADKFEIGGKARNLFQLKKNGFNVPDWLVVSNNYLSSLFPDKDLKTYDTKAIIRLINELKLDGSLINKIRSYFSINRVFCKYFAVRSSALDEDNEQFSFAGQFESFLFVNIEDIADKIKAVWLSAFSERVNIYRVQHGISLNFGIAVIIQEMIDAEVAGVGFGINPVNSDQHEKVISSVFGLGEGLVSGKLNADTYKIKNNVFEKIIAQKKYYMAHSINGGTKIKEMDLSMQEKSTLNDNHLQQINDTLEKLGNLYGKPQDIEFAIKNNIIYLLQTRPITNSRLVESKKGEYILWDNSNIIESYPGVTTPLTFSYITEAYERVYKQLASLMGVNSKIIDENHLVFSNMLGLIQGRVYYNLLSWYKLIGMFPAYSLNAEFMENMMGVKERFQLPKEYQISKSSAYIQMIFILLKIFKNLITLPGQSKSFMENINSLLEKYKSKDLAKMEAIELMKFYRDFDQTLVKKWKAPLVNDCFAMVFFGILQKLCIKYKINTNSNVYNDLLCGSNDVISTQPIHKCIEIATLINNDEKILKIFLENDEKEIWKIINNGNHVEIKSEIDIYIKKFGDRCIGELKLETVSYSQEPDLFIRLIKSYVMKKITTETISAGLEKKLRSDAELLVMKELKGKPFKKFIFNYVLNMTRKLVSNRENMRYERTRVFGMVREIFVNIGKRFFDKGIIENNRDIFYLTKEEIFAFLAGTSVTTNLKTLIDLRKEEFNKYKNMKPTPERIPTYGMVYHSNDFYTKEKIEVLEGDLKGIGCCPGIIKAKVRMVNKPEEIDALNGDILVTTSTDPGWVTLFPTASAIIVERGSLLSHSAIVAREMGIPCIVSVTGLLSTLKTGYLIEMNGSTGIIKILETNE